MPWRKITGYALAGIAILVIMVVAVVFLTGARPGSSGLPKVATIDADTSGNFSVHYHYTAETAYEDILINNSRLTYTFFDVANATLDPYDMSQTAHYTESDLKTVQADLSVGEIQRLLDLINQNHFMALNDTYGGADPGQRNYPYTITVKLDGREKTVVYQSFPWASPVPAEVKAIQVALSDLVEKKLGLSLISVTDR